MDRSRQETSPTIHPEHFWRLHAVYRNHENNAQGEACQKTRFPRPGFFRLAGSLSCRQFGIREALANDLGHDLYEPASIIAVIAVIEPEYLLCDVGV